MNSIDQAIADTMEAAEATVSQDTPPAAPKRKASKPAAKVAPKPLKGERSGNFIRRVILKDLWDGTDAKLAELMVKKYYKDHVTTQKDVAWNRWKMKKLGWLSAAGEPTAKGREQLKKLSA